MQEIKKVKCKKCGKYYATASPNYIKEGICKDCLKQMRLSGAPSDLRRASQQFAHTFPKCPDCKCVMFPLDSFKAGFHKSSPMVCSGCYKRRMETYYKEMYHNLV